MCKLSLYYSSRVMKRCLRQWSTRSWTWYSCFCPSTVWRSWISTPQTVRASCPSISLSWPTMCPWPSCYCELAPRRAPTVSRWTQRTCNTYIVTGGRGHGDLRDNLNVNGTKQKKYSSWSSLEITFSTVRAVHCACDVKNTLFGTLAVLLRLMWRSSRL